MSTELSTPEFNGAPYPKILGPYKRCIDKDSPRYNKIMPGVWTCPEFDYLADNEWHWREKIDGTNIRVVWDGVNVSFKGRTDKATVPPRLLTELESMFTEVMFEEEFQAQPVTLYGEGFGGKIQKGSIYRDTESFMLFDVRIGRWWLKPLDVDHVADSLGIRTAPTVMAENVFTAIEDVSLGLPSMVAQTINTLAEGLVGVPEIPLMTRGGERVIMKIKTEDFLLSYVEPN